MKKEKILNLLKNRVFIGAVCLILGGALFSNGSEVSQLEGDIAKLQEEVGAKDKTISELQSKVDSAAPWFEMQEADRIAEEARIAQEKADREAEEKAAKEAEEARQQHKIGERIVFTYGSKGEFALTIDAVNLTSERNQFADPVKNVVEISYTVENISMEELDFFMDNQGSFYDSEGYKCTTYPLSSGAGTYDIAKGKKASGKEYIGITDSDSAYLEMELGGTEYKWTLQ